MDRAGTVVLGAALTGVCWAIMILALLGGRLRRSGWGYARGDKSWHRFERNARVETA